MVKRRKRMKKIIAFLPAAVYAVLFVFLSVMLREFSLALFLIVLSFTASGVFSCMDKHIFALLFGLLPAVYFAYEGLTSADPASSMGTHLLWTAGGIVLFYICFYASVFVYHRELNRK